MIIRCFVDESYSGNQKSGLFTLTWVCVRPENLAWFELAWINALDKANAQLREQGRPPIKRFHATELNGGKGEFEGWTPEERVELARNLIRVIMNHPTSHQAFTMELTDLSTEWPQKTVDPILFAYDILMKLFMMEIGDIFEEEGMSERIEFVIERGPGSEPMQAAFREMMDEENFKYKRFFESIREGSWESDVLLQVADLFSYEAYKDALRREKQVDSPRKSMEALLELDSVGIRTQKLPREAIAELKRRHDERILRNGDVGQNSVEPDSA
jgi:hypothetical protein